MPEFRIPAAAVAALAVVGSSTAANANPTSTVVSVPLSELLLNGQSYNGSFDISSLLSNNGNNFEVTSATLQLNGYSDFGQTGTVLTGYYTYAYTAYGVGYYSYSCGWGSTCYTYYTYPYTAYATAPSYAPVDGVLDSLTLTSGTDSSTGYDVAGGYPQSYYGSLVAQLTLGSGSLSSANSTGTINFTGTASTNSDVNLTHANLSLTLEELVRQTSAVPEPTTWAMMLVGFGAMGAALRRQRRRASRVVLA